MPASPAGSKRAIFRQVCELIPPHLVPKTARKHGIKSRGITPWSHTVSMLYAQFTHAIGLNDVVDSLRANRASRRMGRMGTDYLEADGDRLSEGQRACFASLEAHRRKNGAAGRDRMELCCWIA